MFEIFYDLIFSPKWLIFIVQMMKNKLGCLFKKIQIICPFCNCYSKYHFFLSLSYNVGEVYFATFILSHSDLPQLNQLPLGNFAFFLTNL